MKKLIKITQKLFHPKTYLMGCSVLFYLMLFVPCDAYAYKNASGCGSPNRINVDSEKLTEEEKAKINEIYAAQYKLCETQEEIARKIGKDYDLGVTSNISNFFGGLDEDEQAALQAANLLQDSSRLDEKLTEYSSIKDPESVQALKYLQKNYPDEYKKLIADLNNVAKYKQEDPALYQKAAEVSTDALRESANTALVEMATHSNPLSSFGANTFNYAAKNARDNAFKKVVQDMKKSGASEELVDKYKEDAIAADGIIAAQHTFGLTEEQARKAIHDSQDETARKLDPESCKIDDMREKYQSKCYSCIIIKTLIETFLNACSKAYDIASEAGLKLLALGSLIWMAFFVMKNVSSLANVEPGAMMNTLITFLFKVMVASILITSGLGVLVKYTINPLLTAGADMGMAFANITSDISGANGLASQYQIKTPSISDNGTSTEIVSSDVMNKIMMFAQDLDENVSTNLVVGHAITCWSINGGAWTIEIPILDLQFSIVNLWLWFCGAAIWFVGFMLTLGIGYYLLDISFKLGFAIMVLPVVIGLWPFNVTKGKVTAVISIMIKSAGTFVFLALTTTYALMLTSVALRDTKTLLDNVEKGNAEWISATFDPTGSYFLIILFAFLYSMKLISSTVSDYVDKFCSDAVFGKADPMHGKLTQMTDMAKQLGMMPVKWASGKIGNAAKEKAKEGAVKTGRFVKGLFKGKANGDLKKDDSEKNKKKNVVSTAGDGLKTTGKTVEQTGKGIQATGKGVETGGKVASAGGKGMISGGKGMFTAGAAMSGTGLGAIVGVPMMIAGSALTVGGAATYAAGKGAEVAGKVTQKVGKAIKKGGKAMRKAGEKIEKAGEKMQKIGDKLKFGDPKASEPKPETSAEAQDKPNDKPKDNQSENGNKDGENKK